MPAIGMLRTMLLQTLRRRGTVLIEGSDRTCQGRLATLGPVTCQGQLVTLGLSSLPN